MTPQTNRFEKKQLHLLNKGSIQAVNGQFNAADWTIVFFATLPYQNRPNVFHHDIRKELPFATGSFDVVYSFRNLNHLTSREGQLFLQEISRILKSGGRGRLVVPDLTYNVKNYLAYFEAYQQTPQKAQQLRYEWATFTLLDQVVRKTPGGEMLTRIRNRQVDLDLVRQLNGDWFHPDGTSIFDPPPAGMSRLRNRSLRELWYGLRRKWKLRLSGNYAFPENWRSCYDDLSLAAELHRAGFTEIEMLDYQTSKIEHWEQYDFDRSRQGNYPVEPSVYAEFVKP